jgi:hypothetical protein
MRVYKALVDGAYEGLSGQALLNFVLERCPKATDKLVVRASCLALSDSDVNDPDVLRAIYGLAVARRRDGGQTDVQDSLRTSPRLQRDRR